MSGSEIATAWICRLPGQLRYQAANQDPGLLATLSEEFNAHPFLSLSPLTGAYLAWDALWVILVLGLAGAAFLCRDL